MSSYEERLAGIRNFPADVTKEKLRPHLGVFEHAGLIPYESWAESGIKVVIFDKDSTITDFNKPTLVPQVLASMPDNFNELFEGYAIGSNNSDREKVDRFEYDFKSVLSLPKKKILSVCKADYFNGNLVKGKPDPQMGYIIADYFGVNPWQIGVVGDRFWSDTRFAINMGAGEIAQCGKVGEGDIPLGRSIRLGERALLGYFIHQGYFSNSNL